MKYNLCTICNNSEFDRFIPAIKRQVGEFLADSSFISICKNCGFIFVNPQGDHATILTTTKRVYENFKVYYENPSLGLLINERVNCIRQLSCSKTPKRILDVGVCTGGRNLNKFRDVFTNCEMYGVDPSVYAVRYGREIYKLDKLFCSSFDECEFPESYFDLVVSINSISKHLDPRYALQKIRRFLSPEGILYLEVGVLALENLHYEWPGYFFDLEDWFHTMIPNYYWYCEEHINSIIMSSGYKIIKKGTHMYNPFGYPQPYYWFWCKKDENIRKTNSKSDLSGGYKKVTDYFFNYCERHTEADLIELFKTPAKSVGLLGPREVNIYLARIIQKIAPETSLWSTELEPEVCKKEGTEGIEITSLQELISDRSKLDMILVTALLEEEEFKHLAKKLEIVSERIYQGFYVRPDRVFKAGSALYYNPTLKENRLLKSFVPNLISKKKDL